MDLLLFESGRRIESLTIVAPLGLRFHDEATGRNVKDGLIVTAYPPENPMRRVRAFANPSGVYALRNLPGLRAVENGRGDDKFWAAPPASGAFVIEVVDGERRFLPFRFTVEAPVRGVFVWADPQAGSPPAHPPGVPVFSSASRVAPVGMAALRAELREWRPSDDHVGEPAAWAVLEARLGGRRLARGVADDQGRVALIFPYPEPVFDELSSPLGARPFASPGADGPSLREQEWIIELDASYGRLRPAPPSSEAPALPALDSFLTQPPADLWEDSERHQPLLSAPLRFGQELILRSKTFNPAPGPARYESVLFITPAGSPP